MNKRRTTQMVGRLPISIILVASLSGAGCEALLDSRHPLGLCGDGVLQTEQGEQCDDGNMTGGDSCSATCQIEACGNGIPDEGEECDRGLGNDNSGDCTMLCKKARCGDGFHKTRGTSPYEVCDDGNSINGDGCNPQCTLRGRVTIIGGTPGGKGMADGIGQAARFARVMDMASDGTYIYLAEQDSCVIRRMRLANGEVETIAGSPGNCVYYTGDGTGKGATFSRNPMALALVGKYLYVGEKDALRRVDLSDGTFQVSTCAHYPEAQRGITALASDPANTNVLYVAGHASVSTVQLPCTCALYSTSNNCTFQLRAGDLNSVGFSNGIGTQAEFRLIKHMALAAKEKALYVADLARVRRADINTWEVKTVAGNAIPGHQDGKGLDARFFGLQAVVHRPTSAGGELYVVEQSNESATKPELDNGRRGWGNVRRIDLQTRQVYTVAGTFGAMQQGEAGEADGFGPLARFVEPWSLALDQGVLYVGQSASLRAIHLDTGQVATSGGVLVKDFSYYEPKAVVAADGKAYVVSYFGDLLEVPISQSAPVRKVHTCPPKVADAHMIHGMVLHGSHIYLLDLSLPGICRVDLAGKAGKDKCCTGCKETCEQVHTLPPYSYLNSVGLAYDGKYFYFSDRTEGVVVKVDLLAGTANKLHIAVNAWNPWGILSLDKHLYVAATEGNQVLRVDPETGITRILGDGIPRTRDGKGSQASFCRPTALATDGISLFVAETHCEPDPATGTFNGHAIRQVELKTEQVTTLVGPGPRPYVVEGLGAWASVNWSAAMAFDQTTGALFVADKWDNVLLKVD